MFSVSLVSCSEDDASIDVVSMDEGVTNQQEYIVVRFSADSGTPKVSARTSETLPESVNDEHGTVNYSLEISNTAAAVTMVINGQKIKAVISVSPDKGTFGDI